MTTGPATSLLELLRKINAARASPEAADDTERLLESRPEEAGGEAVRSACDRLAVYGSLAPGQPNHRVIQAIRGAWHDGFVRGRLKRTGWGSGIGFPAFTWDPGGDRVRVKLLVSSELPRHWERLDAFEGADYLRILVPVEDEGGRLIAVANLYAAATR